MTKNLKNDDDDGCCIVGTWPPRELPPHLIRPFKIKINLAKNDETGLHILRLLNLHTSAIHLNPASIPLMDEPTKQQFVADFNQIFEIKILNKTIGINNGETSHSC